MPGTFFTLLTWLTLLWPRPTAARYWSGGRDDEVHPDLPGHSDRYDLTGSSGYGCQALDWEVIPPRDPDRSDEDDGTLWTGETAINVKRFLLDDQGERDPSLSCTGSYNLPTLFWMGPYLQGEDGTDGMFTLGILAWETNSTDKSDTWHVYRPCPEEVVSDGYEGPPDTALSLKGAVRYSNDTTTTISKNSNTTSFDLGLSLPPPGVNPASSPPQILFNGTYNGAKETNYFRYTAPPGAPMFDLNLGEYLDCGPRPNATLPLDSLASVYDDLDPGAHVNGSLTNTTVTLRLAGTFDGRIFSGVENPEPTVTAITNYRTEYEISFTGHYDARNSSQKLIVGIGEDPLVIAFSAATRGLVFSSWLGGVWGLIWVCWVL
ncbi:hypothetical protein BJX61DRAFT_522061 [Aspergillus egyptiacus]|nr:hypothetical protein BJX61DRAFT_522061 [Aspergillus egyptiacus]